MQIVALLLLSAAFAAPIAKLAEVSTFHIDTFGARFEDPAIRVSPTLRAALDEPLEEGAGHLGPCPAARGVERPPAPVPNVEGRPLVWVIRTLANPVMCALIDAQGRVQEVRVIRGSGDPEVDRAAVRALRAIPFHPAWGHGPRASRHQIVGYLGLRGWHYVERD